MRARLHLKGEVFGRLTVIGEVFDKPDRLSRRWSCGCECGSVVTVWQNNLRSGKTRSCGCVHRESCRRTHGKTGTRVYTLWAGIKSRCSTPSCSGYANCGGRGIDVSEDWQTFESFYRDMGDPPEGMCVGRLDGDGDFCKENCLWTLHAEADRTNAKYNHLTYNGETKLQSRWAEDLGISTQCLSARLMSGWDVEKALSTPRAESRLILYRGEERTINEWAAIAGMRQYTLRSRLWRGVSIEEAMTRPVKNYKKRITK